MLPAGFRLAHGAYSAESTTLALNVFKEATKAAKSSAKPPYLHLSKLEDNPIDVAARPADQDGPSAVPVRWLQNGTIASVDFSKLLSLRPFAIPPGTYAIIPIGLEPVDEMGESIIIHFSQADFKPVEEGKRKKSKKAKPAAQAAPAAPAEKAAAASDPAQG